MTDDASRSLTQVLSELGVEASRSPFEKDWEDLTRGFPSTAADLLDPARVQSSCRLLGMNFRAERALVERAPAFAGNRSAAMLHFYCHRTLVRNLDARMTAGVGCENELKLAWPDLTQFGGDEASSGSWTRSISGRGHDSSLIYVYAFLSAVPKLMEFHRSVGVAEYVTNETLGDLELWLLHYREETGLWGFREQEWLSRHFLGNVFKIGRLQFEMTRFRQPCQAFRNAATGKVQILAEPNLHVRSDGHLNGIDRHTKDTFWVTRLSTSRRIEGHPILEDGLISRNTIRLDGNGWEPILRKGDAVLGVHIPATGPMDYVECCHSFSRAFPFFQRHFPSFHPLAFTCSSWLLDRQLLDHLPTDSNIVQFLREWRLVPEPNADDRQTIERVFGDVSSDIESWPQETSLQKKMIEQMKDGLKWRMGAGIILPEDASFLLKSE